MITDNSFYTISSNAISFQNLKKEDKAAKATRLLKKGIFVYFFLLIFEGALRKWLFPGLSNALLVVRDPIALWLIILACSRKLIYGNLYLNGMMIIAIVSFFIAIFLGHGNLFVALYGARILLLHFPLIFVIGSVFTYHDVIKLGKILLILSIPIALLVMIQFYSPQSAWVNKGLAPGIESAGYSGALGYFRPPATFSFTSGTTQFFGLVACFVFYFWLHPGKINRIILILATFGLLAAIPFSISRTLFYQVGVTLVFTVIAISRKPKYLGQFIVAGVVAIVALSFLSQTSFLKTPIEAFTARFEGATQWEGGIKGSLIDRYFGQLINPVSASSEFPFFGYGLGVGTNVAGSLLTGEQKMIFNAEDEWARLIGELGPLLGLTIIGLRIGFCVKLALASYRKLVLGDLLPWLLLSFCLLIVPQGQWGQSTSLGFSTLIAGLTLASLKRKYQILPSTKPVNQKLNKQSY